MRPTNDVRRVFELRDEGSSKSEIARRTGVSRSQIRVWLDMGVRAALNSPMRERAAAQGGEDGGFCRASLCPLVARVDERAYAYVLGQYLGDGTLSCGRRGVFRLRVMMCDAYPDIMAECIEAIRSVMPTNVVSALQRRGQGCTEVMSHSKHWICLFPQHGTGRKHLRPIVLEPWQERIALDRYPRQLLRGLIHSDGCRVINWVVGKTKDGPKRYTYPRYLFSNESDDIRGIFIEACDRLGIEWRAPRHNMISVARRASVQFLDEFVGPKS
jgi:hypothetical protein